MIQEDEAMEMKFVDGIFEMYKFREQINKARAEIIVTSTCGFVLQSQIW